MTEPNAAQRLTRRTVLAGTAAAAAALTAPRTALAGTASASLLSEPYLLNPRSGSVDVIWHTEPRGSRHAVVVGTAVAGADPAELADQVRRGSDLPGRRIFRATTAVLSRTREDHQSRVPGHVYQQVEARPVHRHLARVVTAQRCSYRVVSLLEDGTFAVSTTYSLAAAPPAGAPVRLLLTSDHQLKAMTPANLEIAAELFGTQLDGVLVAGDLVNVPDRPSEWFDDTNGLAFFAAMSGRGSRTLGGRTFRGAPLMQSSPIYPAPGNHEVMGRWSGTASLNDQFNDPQPRSVAPTPEQSWNADTYFQLFPTLYQGAGDDPCGWYARTIGNVRLISLFVTQIWRSPDPAARGKFQERQEDLADPGRWGYGQFIFESIAHDSAQYAWLERELASAATRQAKYRVVMFHHPAHGLGDNSAPPFADPVQHVERDAGGVVTKVSYSYALRDDQILRDVEPLLDANDVHLVLNGHSHLWNRFRNQAGVHWLETSNVGNTYGAYHPLSGAARNLPPDPNHVLSGDPGGLTPVVPTIAPLLAPTGEPLPYVSSNSITCFSLLDSSDGVVSSYRFNTQAPTEGAVLFDRFHLGPGK